jgi:hypothetical protein
MAIQKRGGSPRATSPRRLLAAEKQRQALELKIGGATLQQIAAELGYADSSGAYRAIQAALKATLQPPADELRRLQYERLERLYTAAHKKAIGEGTAGEPDLEAMDRAIKVLQRINALFGLETTKLRVGGDANAPPIQHEVKSDVFDRIAEYAEALRTLRERRGLAGGDLHRDGAGESLATPPADATAGPLSQ